MCYCVYRDRAKDESTTFAGMKMVIDQFETRGCAVNLTMRWSRSKNPLSQYWEIPMSPYPKPQTPYSRYSRLQTKNP